MDFIRFNFGNHRSSLGAWPPEARFVTLSGFDKGPADEVTDWVGF